jgi:methylated-DNA-[protein]-cysteine S-methyltransferase
MENAFEYTIFKTHLGHFAIIAQGDNLIRTFLPGFDKHKLKTEILKLYPHAKHNPALLKTLQQQIKDYFAGKKVNFNINITPAIKNLSDFSQAILKACHKIPRAQTITYSQLANLANHPNAARAAGTALSKNPLPLIIPCHRIIKSTGQAGNFTAPTGKKLKQKMLNLESPH